MHSSFLILLALHIGASKATNHGAAIQEIPWRRIQGTNDDDVDCSLCKGLDLLSDVVPKPIGFPPDSTQGPIKLDLLPPSASSRTCEDIDISYESDCPARSTQKHKFVFNACCESSIPVYECEKNVHDAVLADYDTSIPPIVRNDTPLDIGLSISYMFLQEIEQERGAASVVFNMTMVWNDPRLKWDLVDNSTCADFITVYTGPDIETNTIWTPPLNLLNRIEGLEEHPGEKATVYSNGDVQMSYITGIEAFCSFKGLAEIPFDTLGCQFIFGLTELSHSYRLYLMEPETIRFSKFGLTAKYNEWFPVPEMAGQGELGIGVVYVNLFFKRAKIHYVSNIIIPTIILTYLSFFTFLLDVRIGERLGFGMALTLVVVAQQIVTSELIVISNVRLWIDKMVAWSFYWVLFTMVESSVIGFMYYVREDREAKKKDKRLSMMSLDARAAMMNGMHASGAKERTPNGRAEEGASNEKTDLIGTDEEQANDAVAEEERTNIESLPLNDDGETPTSEGQESNNDGFSRFRAAILSFKYFLLDVSYRKIDYFCLVFAFVTYSIFITTMFVTVHHSDVWLSGDPEWVGEGPLGEILPEFRNKAPPPPPI